MLLFLLAFKIIYQKNSFAWKLVWGPVDGGDRNDAAIDKTGCKATAAHHLLFHHGSWWLLEHARRFIFKTAGKGSLPWESRRNLHPKTPPGTKSIATGEFIFSSPAGGKWTLNWFLACGIGDDVFYKVEDDPVTEFLGYLISTLHFLLLCTVDLTQSLLSMDV